jgi:hypothetical protein
MRNSSAVDIQKRGAQMFWKVRRGATNFILVQQA